MADLTSFHLNFRLTYPRQSPHNILQRRPHPFTHFRGKNLFVVLLLLALFSQELELPQNPERFSRRIRELPRLHFPSHKLDQWLDIAFDTGRLQYLHVLCPSLNSDYRPWVSARG